MVNLMLIHQGQQSTRPCCLIDRDGRLSRQADHQRFVIHLLQACTAQIPIGDGSQQDAVIALHQQHTACGRVQPLQRFAQRAGWADAQGVKFLTIHFSFLAGTPAQVPATTTSALTTAPAPITASSHTSMPGNTTAPAPIKTLEPICAAPPSTAPGAM